MVMLGTMEGVESVAFVPQVVGTLHSWCTPAVLFLLLNIVIGTIAVTSRMRLNQNNPNNLRRTPSLLTRISSISLSRKIYEDEPLDSWIPQTEEAVEDNEIVDKEVEMEEKKGFEAKDSDDAGVSSSGLLQRAAQKNTRLGRSKSDSQPPLNLKPPPPLPGKMHKYGTFEAAHYVKKAVRPPPPEHVEEEEIGSDVEVNAKADDFINKFKQQLKLQRLQSLIRSKETFNRK